MAFEKHLPLYELQTHHSIDLSPAYKLVCQINSLHCWTTYNARQRDTLPETEISCLKMMDKNQEQELVVLLLPADWYNERGLSCSSMVHVVRVTLRACLQECFQYIAGRLFKETEELLLQLHYLYSKSPTQKTWTWSIVKDIKGSVWTS